MGCGSATNKRKRHDFYETPERAVEQLCEVERLPSVIWGAMRVRRPAYARSEAIRLQSDRQRSHSSRPKPAMVRLSGSGVFAGDRHRHQSALSHLPPSSSGTRSSDISPCCSRRFLFMARSIHRIRLCPKDPLVRSCANQSRTNHGADTASGARGLYQYGAAGSTKGCSNAPAAERLLLAQS